MCGNKSKNMKTLAVIPARYASSRFPGKPLALLNGQSMLQRTYGQAIQASAVDRVVIATDDERIVAHARSFGAEVVLTDPDHPSGTDRVAEVAAAAGDAYAFVVNVQGDEPYLPPAMIDQVIAPLRRGSTVATLARSIRRRSRLLDPNVVKVVCDRRGKAQYFSRAPIPYARDGYGQGVLPEGQFLQHIGLYAFRTGALRDLAALPVTPLEEIEKLEQLRWLEHGYAIQVELTELESHGVDTPEQLAALARLRV